MVPPQLTSRLGFINPGLTLNSTRMGADGKNHFTKGLNFRVVVGDFGFDQQDLQPTRRFAALLPDRT